MLFKKRYKPFIQEKEGDETDRNEIDKLLEARAVSHENSNRNSRYTQYGNNNHVNTDSRNTIKTIHGGIIRSGSSDMCLVSSLSTREENDRLRTAADPFYCKHADYGRNGDDSDEGGKAILRPLSRSPVRIDLENIHAPWRLSKYI
jgi:hypothetical protein